MSEINRDPSPRFPAGTPAPIDGGNVAQLLVRFLPDRGGAVSYRGSASKRTYRCSASDPVFWVLDQDAPHFGQLADFEVVEGSRIDPAERRRSQELEQAKRELPDFVRTLIPATT